MAWWVRWVRWGGAISVVAGAALVLGLVPGRSEPETIIVRLTATPSPATAGPPIVARVKADAIPAFSGAVLGALRERWIEARGQPSQGAFGDLFTATTGVRWRGDAAGRPRAAQVELLTGPQPVPVARARDLARRLHPADSRQVGVYVDDAGQTVEVFRSDVLAEAFSGVEVLPGLSIFGAAPPGTYVQIAERRAPTTSRVLLALGPLGNAP